MSLWEDALDIAAGWATSSQAAAEASRRLREGGARATRPLEALRRTLGDVRDRALAELDELAAEPAEPEPDVTGDITEEASAAHARAVLEAACRRRSDRHAQRRVRDRRRQAPRR